jgi:predicted NBD/HSP70 family sugar kinase
MGVEQGLAPILDGDFTSAALWNRSFRAEVAASGEPISVEMALIRPDGSGSRFSCRILPPGPANHAKNLRFLERTLKFLLWQRGASRVLVSGCEALTRELGVHFSPLGERWFDAEFFQGIFGDPLEVVPCQTEELPDLEEQARPLGRHLDGCRIGFDLGGSDRKSAALIDGEVIFSEEVKWDPYFQSDPDYHLAGIRDSLRRAAAHLPRVDAIGGSTAGVLVKNEVRVSSLFRGVSTQDFDHKLRRVFPELQEEWGDIPFEVLNDGEVTALAGSMALGENAVLGLSLGTSQAAGYVTPAGHVTPWINELAFAPVDYYADAPLDEWSGDFGCGVQYFSQQAVARLAQWGGWSFAPDRPLAERLEEVQESVREGDPRATSIYSTLGFYLGHGIAHYADFYQVRHLLLLGRVTSGFGGDLLLQSARQTLQEQFPELADKIQIVTPGEAQKRHGQAVAAASLPSLDP